MVNEGKPALSSIQIKITGMVDRKDGERVAGCWLLVAGCRVHDKGYSDFFELTILLLY